MKSFLANNRWLVIIGGLLIVVILSSMFSSPSYEPSSGVSIVIADNDEPLVNVYDTQHLIDMLPIAWRHISSTSWVLYEVDVTPMPVEVEECAYGQDKTIIRQRVDLHINITSVKTHSNLAEQTFRGEEPKGCPESISVSSLPSLSNPDVFSEFETSRNLYGSIGHPAEIEQWLLQQLKGQPDLPALTAIDLERSGVEVVTSNQDSNLDSSVLSDFTRLVPDNWKATSNQRPRYEFEFTLSSTILETCGYTLESSKNGTPLLKADRLRSNVTVTILDLKSFEPVDEPQVFQGTEPPLCADRKKIKTAKDFYAILAGDPPSVDSFESWLKTITPDLLGLGTV